MRRTAPRGDGGSIPETAGLRQPSTASGLALKPLVVWVVLVDCLIYRGLGCFRRRHAAPLPERDQSATTGMKRLNEDLDPSDFTAGWLNLSDDVMVQLINQVPVLLGVIIGALGSYLTTAATERARWKRALDSRWDDRRVEAYASYAQSVKRMIKVAGRIAAGRDLGGDDEPLAPTQENLELLADAEAERGRQWETVLLLGHPHTVAAGRSWHERAWRLEAYARALITGSNSDWQAAISAADDARHAFYESARNDLGVGGGALPGAGSHSTRAQRIRNLSD
jgi:hypothetical protein